jgi:hypothetical protein
MLIYNVELSLDCKTQIMWSLLELNKHNFRET